jgi:hypothetical protein
LTDYERTVQAINEAAKRGTISEAEADRMRIGAAAGSKSIGGIDVGGDDEGMSASQQRLRGRDMLNDQVQALRLQEKNLQDQAQAFVDSIPGGVHGMTDQERAQYKQLSDAIAEVRDQQARVYKQSARTGALPAGGGAGGGGGAPVVNEPHLKGPNGEIMVVRDGKWVPLR